ncbi:catecholate siderophore receptor Fiu [Hylemonella gracilis]|uniref:Catecholate siderophore receptor Fiu n=1 Tax=Hylemonella gracilis ATCC 19624 TaxID=887062 RepID=F3KSM6_9BURK|nr:catecholate siderophore receptor Fiu [Hylemonella gracilis]EGI77095.1 catecholate siderophore receptor Fiu [Hylemonella gracilis ATCC 19624]
MAYIKSRKHGQPSSPAPLRTNLIGAAVLATLVLPAGAQTTESQAQLPVVTVRDTGAADYKTENLSSPKFTQPIVDTPQTISVVPAQIMREQGVTTLTEALRAVPGVGTFGLGENGNTQTGDAIQMRGFNSTNSIYVDGVRDLGAITRDVFNTESVEVIKGPSGSDYGRTSPTGSINMVTKQAKSEDSFTASASVGTADYKRGSVDWNQSLFGGSSAIRLNAMWLDSGVDGRDEVKNKRTGIAPSIAFGLNSPTRVFVNTLHVEQNNTPDGGVSTVGLPGFSGYSAIAASNTAATLANATALDKAKRVNSSNYYGTKDDHEDVTADMATVRFEHDFSADTKLNNTLRWGKSTQDYLITAPGGSAPTLVNVNAPSTWTIGRSASTRDAENEILTNQLNLSTRFATAGLEHSLSTGVELTREKQTIFGLTSSGTAVPAANLYNPDSNVSALNYKRNGLDTESQTDTVAAYIFDTLKINDQWMLSAGLRLDKYKTTTDSTLVCVSTGTNATGPTGCSTLGVPTGTVITTSPEDEGTLRSYKLGVLYKPAPNGSIYANYAISQSPPGDVATVTAAQSMQLSVTGSSANNPDMKPQEAATIEVGTKWELVDRKLLLSTALFRTDVSNEVYIDPLNAADISQVGKKRVQGLEVGLVGQVTNDWSVSAGYSKMQAKIIKGAPLSNDLSDDMPYAPTDAFSVWNTVRVTPALTVGGGLRNVSGMKKGLEGTTTTPTKNGTPEITEGYSVIDLMANYDIGKNLSFQLNVNNVTDEEYVARIQKSGWRYVPGEARGARLTMNYTF